MPLEGSPDMTCLDVMWVEMEVHGTGHVVVHPGNVFSQRVLECQCSHLVEYLILPSLYNRNDVGFVCKVGALSFTWVRMGRIANIRLIEMVFSSFGTAPHHI